MKPPCEIRQLQDLITAAAVGPHSSHVRYDASGSIRLKARRDPPVPQPSARGLQLSALKRQQVDTLSHTQHVYLSEVIPSKMTAMAMPCWKERERDIQTGRRDRQEA